MWRIIGLETRNAADNMAIDDAIAECVASGLSPPTIRFYMWREPGAVSIGRFQSAADELDIEACRRLGIEIVRRRTGGGAVFHDSEITYSVAAPEWYFSPGIHGSYHEICSCIIRGLSYLGIKADFRPINDVIVNGKKISGSAQTRRNGVILQHGTILYGLDRQKMFTVLRPSRLKLSDKPLSSFTDGVTCVKEVTGASIEQLYEALLRGFTRGKEWRLGSPTENELALTKAMIWKYDSYEWNFSR